GAALDHMGKVANAFRIPVHDVVAKVLNVLVGVLEIGLDGALEGGADLQLQVVQGAGIEGFQRAFRLGNVEQILLGGGVQRGDLPAGGGRHPRGRIEPVVELGTELFQAQRLGDVIVHAGAEAAVDVHAAGAGGERDDGDIAPGAVLAATQLAGGEIGRASCRA